MSETKPDVESSVPNNQELRGSNLEQNTVEELENAVYSPVITVTTEETSLTKGDLKVHKVVVSEDVSDESMKMKRSTNIIKTQGTNGDSRVESKVYVSITSEQTSYTDSDKLFEGINGNNHEKVSRKTRIPKRKFKQAVEKIKKEEEIIQERIIHDEPNIDIKVKSSIPRLKETKETISKEKEETQKLDDEFDKLYEEINDNNVDITISTPESLRDAEIVDFIFEEIIHAYDEKSEIRTEKFEIRNETVNINTENIENKNDKIEMTTEKVQISTSESTNTEKEGNSIAKVVTNTEKVKSKIPLLKRKSEQEIKIPNRRSSLKKSISIDDTKIPMQTKSTAKLDLAKIKPECQISESCSTIGKLESDSGKKIESIESKTIIKTIKTHQINMEHSKVASNELTTTSNEVSKCKIPVKSHTKDKVEKLNSATLNKLPAKSNIIGKIVNQHTPSEASKSSLETKAIETHRISKNLIEKALRDHQEVSKNSEKCEEKLTKQPILAQENQSIITTENKTSQNGISESENRQISSNEIQETSHSTNSRIVERSFTVTNTQWDNVTKNLDASNEITHINMDFASIKDSDEIKESLNNNNIITEISKTDVDSETIKTTEFKETIRVSTLAYDSSIDFKTEITNQSEIRDSEYNLNNSNTKVKEKEIISYIVSRENQNEIKSEKNVLVKSSDANKLQTITTESDLINTHKKDITSKFESNEETDNKTINIDIKTKTDNTNIPKYDGTEINNNKILETKAYSTSKLDSLNSNLKTRSESKTTNKVMTQMIASRIESITGSINKPDDCIKEYKVTTDKSLSIENTKLKDSKETDSNKLNVNNKISSQTQNIDELNEEDIIMLRGKVNRIISRLDSREVRIEKTEDDLPKNVSVVSKIAIFENNEPENLKNDLQITITNNKNDDDRPKIVDEILKYNENIDTDKTIPKDTIFNIYDDNKDKKFDYHTVFNKVHSSVLRRLKSLEMNSNINLKDVINQENLKDKVMIQNKPKPIEEKEEAQKVKNISKINEEEHIKINRTEVNKKEMIKDEYNRTKSLAELHFERDCDRNTFDIKDKTKLQEEKRAKSLATLDLGNVLKGRVKQMVLRMNSIEQVNKERRELERSRPRRSVMTKAAVFEKKVVPDKVENLPKIDKDRSNDTPLEASQVNEENFQERISELNSAKAKYGKWQNMPTIELRDGSLMPVLAVGTALLEPKLIKHIIAAAIDLGYRAIDTAFIYGNEKEIGEAIRSKIEDGTVRREDLFIISKLWSTFHRRDLVEAACRHSLDTMGLEYFDLYMIHNPMSFREGSNPLPKIANVLQYSQYDYLEAWYGMETVVAKGLVKRVGLSNFNSAQVDRVIEKAKIKPVVNQVECHPYLTQHNLEDFCTTRNMKLSCFSVLGSKGTPKELKNTTSAVIDDPLVQVMAAGLGVTPAQLLIAYQLHHGRNVVVKSSTGAHLWDNLRALDLKLDQTQVSALDALNKNKRTFTFKGMGDTHKNYPFKIAF